MGPKSKGSRTERELVQLFKDTGVWAAIRIAGSGLTSDPNTDILAGNGRRHLAIECKSVKGKYKHLYPEQIENLTKFSEKFGAEPWLAIRFNTKGWYFLKSHDLTTTKTSNLSINLKLAEKKGLKFSELIKS